MLASACVTGAAVVIALLNNAMSYAIGAFFLLLNLPLIIWAVMDSIKQARSTREDYRLKEYNKWWIYLALLVLSTGGSTLGHLLMRTYWIETFSIPSISMAPTIQAGDKLIARKAVYTSQNPQRGEVVIFRNPEDRSIQYVKRVVGLAGDRIAIQNSVLLINGEPVSTKPTDQKNVYLETLGDNEHKIIAGTPKAKDFAEIIVPPNHCFVLGDNRDMSRDSRYFGPVPYSSLTGQASFIYFSRHSAKQLGSVR